MAISFIAAGTTSGGSNPSPTVPSGYADGDLLILVTTGTATPTTPTGWTQRYAAGTGRFITILTKYASSSETTPVNLTQSGATSKAVILCYRGAGSYDVVGTINSGTSTSPATTSQTTTYANDYVISIYADSNTAATFTAPASTTSRVNSASTASVNGILVVDELQAAAGASATRTATLSTSVAWAAINISFVPTRTLYWVGGTGTWDQSTTGNWANSSGGSGTGIKPPVQNEQVIIDSSSGTGTITAGGAASAVCNDLTVTASQALTLGVNGSALSIYGSISLPSGGSFAMYNSSNWTLTFASGTTGKTITTNGKTFPPTVFNGVGGGWTLQDDFSTNSTGVSSGSNVTLTAGAISLNNFTMLCNLFVSSNSNTRSIAFGTSGKIQVAGTGQTVINMAIMTGFTNTGTPDFNCTYSGATGTRTISIGSTSGSSEANSINVNITAGSDTITLSNNDVFRNLNWTGYTGSWTHGNFNYTLYGDLTFASGMTLISNGNGVWSFKKTTGVATLTTNGKSLNGVEVNAGANTTTGLQLGSNAVMKPLSLTQGLFDDNGYTLQAESIDFSNFNVRKYKISTEWTIINSTSGATVFTTATNNNLSYAYSGTPKITIFDPTGLPLTFAAGGFDFTGITLNLSSVGSTILSITNGATFTAVSSSKTVGYTIILDASATYSTTTWSAQGTASNKLAVIKSSSTGTQAILNVTNAATLNYVTLQDIVISSGVTITNGYVSNNVGATVGSGSYTVVWLSSSGTWTVPSDWNNSNNFVHIYGGGGGGAGSYYTSPNLAGGGGGGGGGYAQLTNQSLTPGSSILYTIGAGGSRGNAGANGSAGGSTLWNSSQNTIAYVSSQTSVQNTSSTTITVTVPSVSNGNLMVMIVQSTNAGNTWTTPTGWTSGLTQTVGVAVFWRVAASEPASYTVTQSSSRTADASITVFTNAQFDVAGTPTGSSNPVAPTAINVSYPNSAILYWAGRNDSGSTTFSTPTGYTTASSDSDSTAPSCAAFYLLGRTNGTYTPPTSTPSSASKGMIISLSPTFSSSAVTATGGSGGSATTTTSTGGAGGTGSGGSTNYTGGTGGAGGTTSTLADTGGGGGGGGAGSLGNGGTGGAGNAGGSQTTGGGGGGGNSGGSSGSAGSSGNGGNGGNNANGAGGGVYSSSTAATLGGGGYGGGGTGGSSGSAGSNGVEIAGILGSGGGGGGGANNATTTSAIGGTFGGGGGGAGGSTGGTVAGAAGNSGGILVLYGGSTTNSGFFFFM